jgi:hypothetical protein
MIRAATLALLTLYLTSSAEATVINGGFESGRFDGWLTKGAATVDGPKFRRRAPFGRFQALLETGRTEVLKEDLETFLGFDPGLDDPHFVPTRGAAIKQTFPASRGDAIDFEAIFLTDETPGDPQFRDFAFVRLEGPHPVPETRRIDVAAEGFVESEPDIGFAREIPWSGRFTIASAGRYTLSIGVLDVTDFLGESGLLIDLSHGRAVPIPGPGGLILLVAAWGVRALWRRARERTLRSGAAGP